MKLRRDEYRFIFISIALMGFDFVKINKYLSKIKKFYLRTVRAIIFIVSTAFKRLVAILKSDSLQSYLYLSQLMRL